MAKKRTDHERSRVGWGDAYRQSIHSALTVPPPPKEQEIETAYLARRAIGIRPTEVRDAEHWRKGREDIQRDGEIALRQVRRGRRVGQTSALIVGAGHCDDIPLRWLTEHFDRVTLTDNKLGSMETAVQDLPRNLQAKLLLVTTDITGSHAATVAAL